MGEAFSALQSTTGLNCLPGCGRCCMNPDIEASVMEMLPFALKMYDDGRLDEWLLKTESPGRNFCLLLEPHGDEGKGACLSYEERPSICRMFGVAGYFDKNHSPTLSVCKYIKENHLDLPKAQASTPMLTHWSSKMASLHPELTKTKLPMNQAIREALNRVAFMAQYKQV